MTYSYRTRGTCSSQVDFDLEGDVVKNIRFTGGCHGNTQGVSALCEGMTVGEIIKRLDGIDCRGRGTSCPDQLAKAIKHAISAE